MIEKGVVERLLHRYELEAQHLRDDMPEHERRGSGPYYRHRLYMVEEVVKDLKGLAATDDGEVDE